MIGTPEPHDQTAPALPEAGPTPAAKPAAVPARASLQPEAHLWQGGWALAVAAGGAAMLAIFGAVSSWTLVGLAIAAAPGLLGYVWRPDDARRYGLLAVWAAAMTASASLTGGATGPLAAWCAAPLLLGALTRALPQGAALAVAAVAATATLQGFGLHGPAETGASAVMVAAVGLILLFVGFAGAVLLAWRVLQLRANALDAEKRWFEGALAELPYLGLALDPDGKPEAVFGAPPAGLDAERLGHGLVDAAAPEDRAGLYAAICGALDHGSGEASFSPYGAPARRLRLALRRRGDQGLSAVIHDISVEAAERSRLEAERAALEAMLNDRAAAPATDSELERRLADAEVARERAEQSAAAKSRFLANMSHELRTPLNAIMGFSDIMRARMFGELTPKYGEYAELIHESGRHLMDLINDVLDMSKIEAERYALSRERFDARDAVNAALRLVRLQADEGGVQLRGLMPADGVLVDADKRALKQIVLNLVSNALKFTPRGGSITVTARPRGEDLELVVADTGEGIAPEDLERLGRPFEQAGDAQQRNQGTGLGLSLVKALAGLHGGTMSIESALGEGTAVTVRLPVMAAAAEQDERPSGQVIHLPVSR